VVTSGLIAVSAARLAALLPASGLRR
jgi:hypothetical protein